MAWRLLPVLPAWLALAGFAHAQTWFVDPVSGSDGNAGTPSSPFRTLTHAMTVVSAGHEIWLADGVYSAAQEAWPVTIAPDVQVRPWGAAQPVLDGDGAAVLLQYLEDPRPNGRLEGLMLQDCDVAVLLQDGAHVTGLEILDCTFAAFGLSGGAAIDFRLSVPGNSWFQRFEVRDCRFAGGGSAVAAISIRMRDEAQLSRGGIVGCWIQGGVEYAILVDAGESAEIDDQFRIAENQFEGYAQAGIRMEALGSLQYLDPVRLECAVEANAFHGAGGPVVGLDISARGEPGGGGAQASGRVAYNEFIANEVNVLVSSENHGTGMVGIATEFFGNIIRGASSSGVEVRSMTSSGALVENRPLFGGAAGANTFQGNTVDLLVDLESGPVDARHNFWMSGPPVVSGTNVDVSEPLSHVLESDHVWVDGFSQWGGRLVISAASGSRYVDYPGDGDIGQCTVFLDGVMLAQGDISADPDGGRLVVDFPARNEGTIRGVATNPGGQTGTFEGTVTAYVDPLVIYPLVSGGCFVATAAHGDYDAPEVYELRRLRDQYLQTTGTGRAFIGWYYEEGPAAAAWIAERPWARSTARAALAAPVALSRALNDWNPGQRFGAAALLLGLAFAARRRRA